MNNLKEIKAALAGEFGDKFYRAGRGRVACWGLRFKLAVCLLLNREVDYHDYDGWRDDMDNQSVTVAYVNGGVSQGSPNNPAIYYAEGLRVGRGVFGNWWYFVELVSSD